MRSGAFVVWLMLFASTQVCAAQLAGREVMEAILMLFTANRKARLTPPSTRSLGSCFFCFAYLLSRAQWPHEKKKKNNISAHSKTTSRRNDWTWSSSNAYILIQWYATLLALPFVEKNTELCKCNFLISIDCFNSDIDHSSGFLAHRCDDKFAETNFSLRDVNDSVLKVNDKETKYMVSWAPTTPIQNFIQRSHRNPNSFLLFWFSC